LFDFNELTLLLHNEGTKCVNGMIRVGLPGGNQTRGLPAGNSALPDPVPSPPLVQVCHIAADAGLSLYCHALE